MCFDHSAFLLYSPDLLEAHVLFCNIMFTLSKYTRKWSFAKQRWPEPVTTTPVNPKIAEGGSKREREVLKSFETPSKLFCQAEMFPGRWFHFQTHLLSLRTKETLLSEPYQKLSSCPPQSLLSLKFVNQWEKQTLPMAPLMSVRQTDKAS